MNGHGQFVRPRSGDAGHHAVLFAKHDGGSRVEQEFSVQFAAGPSAAAAARNAMAALDGRVEAELLSEIRLLVSELVTNSVRHSSVPGAGAVGLRVAVARDTVRVEVTDRGGGFEPKPRVPGQSKASGWGLFLVDRLADRWGVARNNITRVWFEVDDARRKRRSGAAP